MKILTKTRASLKGKMDRMVNGVNTRYDAAMVHVKRWKAIAFSEENNNYFAALSFVPFIGWLVPMYLKEENAFCQEQSKYGFYMSLLFTSVVVSLIFLGIFFSRDWRVVRLINVILIYLVYAVYFGFCVYGINESIKNRKAELIDRIPMIGRLRMLIEL